MRKRVTMVMVMMVLASCTDTQKAQFATLGTSSEIVCYSGGREIYRGRSTGVVQNEEQSDGWKFKDAATGTLVRVSGDCVVTN